MGLPKWGMGDFRLFALSAPSIFIIAMSPLTMDPVALNSLQSQLKSSVVFTPDSDGYQDSLRRWSNTGVKPAVSEPLVG